ncbi:DMT family transporter [Microbacteriaceae bacterium VKM Ac-2854]|nr:DMT family transporter [Microbacteriaceae bacterium VKM Ac-2854]
MAGVVSLLAATLFWAGNYIVGVAAVAEIPPLSLVLLRWAFAVLPLFAIAQLIERPRWRELLRAWRWHLLLSVLGMLGYTLFLYAALQFTDAFNASLINAFNPALITLAAVIFLRERLTRTAVLGIIVALVGVLVVLSGGDVGRLLSTGFGTGDLLMIGAILAWTAYTIVGRRGPRLPPISSTAVQAGFAVLVMLPVVLFTGGLVLPSTSGGWGALVFIAIFPSVLSYVLWNRALTVIPPARAGVFLNLITVFTALFTVLAGHPFTLAQIVGGVIVIAGVAVANERAFRRAPAV